MQLKPEKRKRLIDKHRDALTRHGHSPQAVYWSNTQIQELRFKVLTDIGIESGASVLDVGCGFGDLYSYLKRNGTTVEYTGVELSPDLSQKAQELNPDATFFCGDLFEYDPTAESFDYVLLSGALNEALDDDGEYAHTLINRMYQTACKAIAFNLLNAKHEWTANRYDLQSFQPQVIKNYCKQLNDNVELIEDYLENDFSVYIRKA